jgi:GNAT superfamily N-acetyltransferase
MAHFRFRNATIADTTVIFELIKQLAIFEKLEHEVIATESSLKNSLFSGKCPAEVIIAEIRSSEGSKPPWQNAGFALFFTSYSTFLARPGIYLEDLFIREEFRSQGAGARFLAYLAKLAIDRGCGRLEWSVLNWNQRARDFYVKLGAVPMQDWTVHRLSGDSLSKLAKQSM